MATAELHPVKLPEALLSELNRAAAPQNKSVDARARTESLGICEEEVEQIIAESRRSFAQRG